MITLLKPLLKISTWIWTMTRSAHPPFFGHHLICYFVAKIGLPHNFWNMFNPPHPQSFFDNVLIQAVFSSLKLSLSPRGKSNWTCHFNLWNCLLLYKRLLIISKLSACFLQATVLVCSYLCLTMPLYCSSFSSKFTEVRILP